MEGQYDSIDHGDGKKKENMGICTDKQTAKEHVFMSHDVCECVTLLAVRGEREDWREGVGKEAADPTPLGCTVGG